MVTARLISMMVALKFEVTESSPALHGAVERDVTAHQLQTGLEHHTPAFVFAFSIWLPRFPMSYEAPPPALSTIAYCLENCQETTNPFYPPPV